MVRLSRVALLFSVSATSACAAQAEGWRASGLAYGYHLAGSNEASVVITITKADGSPVAGLTQDDFFVFGICGVTITNAIATVSTSSIAGDYILHTKVAPFDLGKCQGFVVKVIEGPISAAVTKQKLSVFVPFKR